MRRSLYINMRLPHYKRHTMNSSVITWPKKAHTVTACFLFFIGLEVFVIQTFTVMPKFATAFAHVMNGTHLKTEKTSCKRNATLNGWVLFFNKLGIPNSLPFPLEMMSFWELCYCLCIFNPEKVPRRQDEPNKESRAHSRSVMWPCVDSPTRDPFDCAYLRGDQYMARRW